MRIDEYTKNIYECLERKTVGYSVDFERHKCTRNVVPQKPFRSTHRVKIEQRSAYTL
jgi:hypothetical protein